MPALLPSRPRRRLLTPSRFPPAASRSSSSPKKRCSASAEQTKPLPESHLVRRASARLFCIRTNLTEGLAIAHAHGIGFYFAQLLVHLASSGGRVFDLGQSRQTGC